MEAMKQEKVADQRNRDQVEKANMSDQKLASKYLSYSVDDFLPSTIPRPDDALISPAWLMGENPSLALDFTKTRVSKLLPSLLYFN
jgi:hypothetical protein